MTGLINALDAIHQICHQDQPPRHKSPISVTRVRIDGRFQSYDPTHAQPTTEQK